MQLLIERAITERRIVTLDYPPGRRRVEPHAFGYSSDGNLLLRAYQVEGASASGEHVNWKLFRLDRVSGLLDETVSFAGPRPEYKRGDKAMRGGIICEL